MTAILKFPFARFHRNIFSSNIIQKVSMSRLTLTLLQLEQGVEGEGRKGLYVQTLSSCRLTWRTDVTLTCTCIYSRTT